MPDHVPRPPKTPPQEPLIKVPDGYIRLPPDLFPPKPEEEPDINGPMPDIRRPPMEPPQPVIDRAA